MTSFGGHMAKDFLSNITRGVWKMEIVYYLLDNLKVRPGELFINAGLVLWLLKKKWNGIT
jgi:hypothetical protein